jgi:hypothetical protein
MRNAFRYSPVTERIQEHRLTDLASARKQILQRMEHLFMVTQKYPPFSMFNFLFPNPLPANGTCEMCVDRCGEAIVVPFIL